jgi:hypothetical protein
MKRGVIITLFIVNSFTINAQDYNTSIGFRLGWESGITIKHFIASDAAIEGIVGTSYWGGIYLCGLYELHTNPIDVEGLSLYYGGGAHLRSWSNGGWGLGNPRWKGYSGNYLGIGVDGIIGLEYKIPDAPLNISLDIKPALDVIESFWVHGGGALSIRYTF